MMMKYIIFFLKKEKLFNLADETTASRKKYFKAIKKNVSAGLASSN